MVTSKTSQVQYQYFIECLRLPAPPVHLAVHLKALWYDAKGDWESAHDVVANLNDDMACRVHAYLHRKEGDDINAGYWYRKSGKQKATSSLKEEWTILVKELTEMR